MKGYIPEGSYFLQRELFENEVVGSSVQNYTDVNCEIQQRDEILIIPGLATAGFWAIGDIPGPQLVTVTQSFTPVNSFPLTHIYFRCLGIVGAPNNILFQLYDNSGAAGAPGNLLSSSEILTAVQVAAIPGGLPGWVRFDFPSPYRCAAGVTYHLQGFTATTGAPNNYYQWSSDNTNPYAGGTAWTFIGAGPWVQQAAWDNECKICGEIIENKLMMELTHQSSALHDGKLQSNDFVQEIGLIFRISKYNTVGANLVWYIRDALGQIICRVRALDADVEFWTGAAWITAAGILTYEEWHMIRLFIHNGNSPDSNRVELLVDGFKYWLNAGVLTNVVGTELAKEINDIIPYEHWFLTAGTNAGDYWYIDSVISKDWADMIDHQSKTGNLVPYSQILIECNDHATFKKLTQNDMKFSVTQSFNKSWDASIDLALPAHGTFDGLNTFMEDVIKDDDSDNDSETFTYDNEVYIFYQAAALVDYGYKATTTADNTLQDLNGDFINDGVQAGDHLWFFKEGLTEDNPHTIVAVGAGTLIFTPNLPGFGDTDISYLISHGIHRVFSSSLGDYIFIGRFKNFNYSNDNPPNLNLLCLGDGYISIQKKIHCKSARYYQKGINDLLVGHFKWDSLADPGTNQADQIVDGLQELGNYGGLLGDKISDIEPSPDSEHTVFHQAFKRNIYDLSTELLNTPMTKIWTPTVALYDAIISVCNSLVLEMQIYTDREYRNERMVFFRLREDETGTPIINLFAGYIQQLETETDRSVESAHITKGSRDFIDYVSIDGSTDDVGIPLVGDEPANFQRDGFSREIKRSDSLIRTQNLVNDTALAIYTDLNRKPEQGDIAFEPTSLIETWFNSTYPGDSAIEDVYKRQSQEGWFRGDSDWFHYGVLVNKDRTTQGHLNRKPFTLLGEVLRYYYTATFPLNFIVHALNISQDQSGMKFRLEPNVEPFNKEKMTADATRERDFIAKQFEDPTIQQCTALPLPKSFIELKDFIGVGIAPAALAAFADQGAGSLLVDFLPFDYVDEVDSSTAEAYGFYYRLNAGPGPWQIAIVRNQGINLITDIDDSNPTIELNNDVVLPLDYGYAAPNNWAYITTVANQVIDVMIVLTLRHILEAGVQSDTPRQNPPDETGVPGADEMNQIIKLIHLNIAMGP